MANPLDQPFTDRILSWLHWTNLAAENLLPIFFIFKGIILYSENFTFITDREVDVEANEATIQS